MRALPLLLVLAACAPEEAPWVDPEATQADAQDLQSATSAPTAFYDMSRIDGVTGGAALLNEGGGYAGMGGFTCEFDPISGTVDVDIVTGEVTVVDSDGVRALLLVEDALVVLQAPTEAPGNLQEQDTTLVDNVVQARLWDEGVVALRDTHLGCLAEWAPMALSPDGESSEMQWFVDHRQELPGAFCDPSASVDIDRASGELYLASDGQLLLASPDQLLALPGAGDVLAWDADRQQLYVAGGDQLTAWQAGEIRWATTLEGPATQMVVQGELGVVVMARADHHQLLGLHPDSGALWGERDMGNRGDVTRLIASADGAVLGLVSAEALRFYEVAR